jgi:hypothetical protein
VFPIAPPFNPIGFAQSPPLFTYIAGGPKRKDTPSFNLIFYFGGASIVSTNFFFFIFCNGPIKLAHCKKIKKS